MNLVRSKTLVSVPRQFFENYPLMIVACLFIWVAVTGAWLTMPLSDAQNLSDIQSSDFASQFKKLMLVLLLGYCAVTVLKWRIARVFIAAGIFFLVLYISLSLTFFNGENVWEYITESFAYREMRNILAIQPIPNAGGFPEVDLVYDAFKAQERLEASLGLMAWGARLSLILTGLLLAYAVLRSRQVLLATLLTTFLAAIFLVVSGLGNVGLAYLKVNKGIRDANSGAYMVAIAELNEAARLDPAIVYSKGYPLLLSYLHYSAFGPEHAYSHAYQLHQKYQSGNYRSVVLDNKMFRENMTSRITVNENVARSDRAGSAILRFENELVSNALMRIGLQLIRRQDWAGAEVAFSESALVNNSPISRLALMDIYNRTRRHELCLTQADELLGEVVNAAVSADIWTLKGDCHKALGQYVEARQAYEMSISLDADKNYRAVKRLSGT